MMIVGLTGGIGSGKTTVADFFVELEVPVYNSDKEARKLMKSSKKVKKAIIDLLGKKAYKGKKLNKKYISERIFKDKKILQEMNDIVHPAVRKHFLKWAEKENSPYVIQETALIFENSMQDFYDYVILVTAPIDLRIQRVMERDDSSREAVLARLSNQLPDEEKEPLADYIIENIELRKTQMIVAEVHKALITKN